MATDHEKAMSLKRTPKRKPWEQAANLLVLDDWKEIVAMGPVLEALAARCGQAGALHWLPYFVDPGVTQSRSPRLVVRGKSELRRGQLCSADDLTGAALIFEYTLMGIATGVFTTADAVGINTVVAEPGQRLPMARAAMAALLQRSGSLAFATVEGALEVLPGSAWFAPTSKLRWAYQERTVARVLPLKRSLDETLAQMGKSTRFNLKYYRRRLARRVSCEYVADAGAFLPMEDLEALNRASLNPVSGAEFRRRVASARTEGSFLSGLRDASGAWLSLVGGWRSAQTTVLFWQLNTKGHEKDSIGTVMRSYFIEHEIGLGARGLLIYGGTPHTMRYSFQEDPVIDLVIRKHDLRAVVVWALVRAAAMWTRLRRRPNFFLETIHSSRLDWRRADEQTRFAVQETTSGDP